VCPVEDIQLLGLQFLNLLVYKFRVIVLKRRALDELSVAKSIGKQIRPFV